MSQDYQTRQSTIEEGNLTGPIRTGHNQHTHTGNTRQPELNSRVPRVHPSSRAQLEGCLSELNSRNRGTHTARRHNFRTVWRGTRTAMRQAPQTRKHSSYRLADQPSPPGAHSPGPHCFRHNRLADSPYTARRTDYPKIISYQTYRPQPTEHVREPMPRITHHYQTRQSTIEEGNLTGPIRTGHNQHTHTGNTRQPELNSRVPRVHPSSRAQLEGCLSELNSRNAPQLPDRLAGDTYRHAPSASNTQTQQLPPGGSALTARRTLSRTPLLQTQPPSGFSIYRQANVIPDLTISFAIAWQNPIPSPGASYTMNPLVSRCCLADLALLPGAVSVLVLYWFFGQIFFAPYSQTYSQSITLLTQCNSRTMSGEVRRGRTTSGQVRVSIINPESEANYLCVVKAEKSWGSPFLFVIDDDRVIRYTGADDDTYDVVNAQTTEWGLAWD
ncbi:hypothetical protein DEO72_LG3g740 [Vigna unguiculata]|uniref:Uncharacterized protein n=1 Tax=Vigna unguiculata TaxID=3917 RepID=A0A4D6LCC7_VIGUN|nr:hypothetical protein DEO72_LG3g740 [Vigna unguiculata]